MVVSTRDEKKKGILTSVAINKGLASDGGLFVHPSLPKLSKEDLQNIKDNNYYDLASFILSLFIPEFTKEEIKDIICKSYDCKFDEYDCVKLNKTIDTFVLELYHGPTCAFKDMALLVLPNLLSLSKIKNKYDKKTIILTATSGDTGSSALNGFRESNDTKIVVFYPTDGVSLIQERQMLDLRNEKAKVIAIKGNFDDAQSLVKKLFNDCTLRNSLNDYELSSANSINIGRLLPQIVYYFQAYNELVKNNEIKLGDDINFVVPTGNFGDILAGFIAREMGLPINKLICASNKNDVLTEFLTTGVYNSNRVFYKTISPSMDILISSNLERLLYYVTKDPRYVRTLMNELKEKGCYKLDAKYDLSMLYGVSLSEDETKDVIRKVYNDNNYLIDPHTAVGYGGYYKYKEQTNDQTKAVVLSTASPFKFPVAVLDALGYHNVSEIDAIRMLEYVTKIKAPIAIKRLSEDKKKEVWIKEEAYNKATKLIKELAYE